MSHDQRPGRMRVVADQPARVASPVAGSAAATAAQTGAAPSRAAPRILVALFLLGALIGGAGFALVLR